MIRLPGLVEGIVVDKYVLINRTDSERKDLLHNWEVTIETLETVHEGFFIGFGDGFISLEGVDPINVKDILTISIGDDTYDSEDEFFELKCFLVRAESPKALIFEELISDQVYMALLDKSDYLARMDITIKGWHRKPCRLTSAKYTIKDEAPLILDVLPVTYKGKTYKKLSTSDYVILPIDVLPVYSLANKEILKSVN